MDHLAAASKSIDSVVWYRFAGILFNIYPGLKVVSVNLPEIALQ